MSTFAPLTILDEKRYSFLSPIVNPRKTDELAKLKLELAVLKNANPILVAEMALELQLERMRAEEAVRSRDTTLDLLADAYASVRQKDEIIERMQNLEREGNGGAPFPTHLICVKDTVEIDRLNAHIVSLEATVEELRSLVSKPADPPPCYEENVQKKILVDRDAQTVDDTPPIINPLDIVSGEASYIPPQTDDIKELINARNSVLAEIPLPENPPDATLTAIVFPSPVTLHEFLNMAPPPLKNALSTYRILQNHTTTWCPDREEHGFMHVPAFKCSTNPKIATAHRWSAVDPIGRMSKPTECFYHREGIWYYAGSYKAFKMDIVSTKEWSQLPSETTSALIKETIAARKNSSPQNTYETSQLYASGALKVACIGLQCVGFNQEIYKAIIEHSEKLTETKWKSLIAAPPASAGAGGATGSPASIQTSTTGAAPNTVGTPNSDSKAAKAQTAGVSRHVHRAAGSVVSAVGSPVHSQAPPGGISQLPAKPASVGVGATGVIGNGISMVPLSIPLSMPLSIGGVQTHSIWSTTTTTPSLGSSVGNVNVNAANGVVVGAGASGPGSVPHAFVNGASGSPLSAASRVFEIGVKVQPGAQTVTAVNGADTCGAVKC